MSGDHNHIDKKLVCICSWRKRQQVLKKGFHSLFSTYDTASTAKQRTIPDRQTSWGRHVTNEEDRRNPQQNCHKSCQKQVMKSAFPCSSDTPAWHSAESPQHIQNVKSTGHRCNKSRPETPKYTEISLQKCWVPAQTTARESQRMLVPSPWNAIVIAVVGSKARATLIRKELEKFGPPKTWIEIAAAILRSVSPRFFLNHEVSKSSEPSMPSSIGTSKPKSWPTPVDWSLSSGSAKPNQPNRAIPMEQNVSLGSIACHHDTKIPTILAMCWKVDFFKNGPLCKDCKDYSFVVVVDVDCATNTLIWNGKSKAKLAQRMNNHTSTDQTECTNAKHFIALLSFVTKTQEANHNRYSQETILIKQPTQTSTNENPNPPMRSKIPTMRINTNVQTGDKFKKLSAKAVYTYDKKHLRRLRQQSWRQRPSYQWWETKHQGGHRLHWEPQQYRVRGWGIKSHKMSE